MPNDLTITSRRFASGSLFNVSKAEVQEIIGGRCDQDWLITSLRDVLSLYYQPTETPEQRARQIALFVSDLSQFSDGAVQWAIREWRQKHDRRPTPAALRQLCMMRLQEAARVLQASRPPETGIYDVAPLTDEERANRAEVIARAAKASGFVQTQHGQWELPDPKPAPTRVPHWSETAAPDDARFAALRKARAENPLCNPKDAAA